MRIHCSPFLLCLAALLHPACGPQSGPLTVKSYQLRDTDLEASRDPMARGEKQRRLHGAITVAERRARIGQYYDFVWRDPAGPGGTEKRLVFEYQQGGTASKILSRTWRFPAAEDHGKAEFHVTGDSYFDGGRVLAWKSTLYRGDDVIATKQSYLWK